MMDLLAIARARSVRIEDVAMRRGLALRGRIELSGPCPKCGGADRFAINTTKQVFNCRGCQRGGDVISLLMLLDDRTFHQAVEELTGGGGGGQAPPMECNRDSAREQPSAGDHEKRQAKKAAWLWSQRRPIEGTIAENYLRKARGYDGLLPETLGFLPPSKPEHCPAIVAAFAVCDEPEPGVVGEPRDMSSVHLTLLNPNGSGKADVKPNKLIVGRPLGRPIVLAPPNDLLGLAITEGIEDALTAHQATALGAWAAGAAGFMPSLAETVPDYIEAITIYAHPDRAGQDGAQELAELLDHRGIEVLIEGIA
jgi:hypothetical protein